MKRSLPILSERASFATGRLVNCNGCTACCERGGLVYVRDDEVKQLERIGVPVIAIDNISFIKRLPDGSCPMLDRENRNCSIYEDRPLCCRLFPLDVLRIDGRLQWALSDQCPEDRKHFEGSQGPDSRLGTGSVARLASTLETLLKPNDIAYFDQKERVSARIELLEDDENHWIPIAECKGFGD